MILAIIGFGRSGKDTAAEYLRKHTTLHYVGSTSWAALPLMADHLNTCEQIAWDSRHEHRPEWFAHCSFLKSKDPLFLVKMLLKKKATIVTGLREKTEVEACAKAGHHLMWIDARERGIISDPTVKDFDITCADSIIGNNKQDDLQPFYDALKQWAMYNGVWITEHEQKG